MSNALTPMCFPLEVRIEGWELELLVLKPRGKLSPNAQTTKPNNHVT